MKFRKILSIALFLLAIVILGYFVFVGAILV